MKKATRVHCRTTLLIATLLALAACSGETHHAHYAGTPNEWWSDNYVAMLQDANDSGGSSVVASKPVRMRIF